MQYLLALDQGTTSSRAIIFSPKAELIAIAQQEIPLITPKPGWVEQDPMQIWQSQYTAAKQALQTAGLSARDICALGITNQRETTIIWNRKTGIPIAPAISWQDQRTHDRCLQLRQMGHAEMIQHKTGLILNPYFSATKIAWLLDNTPGAHAAAARGELAFGTVDSWLIWQLTNGACHVIDISNASRTLLLGLNGHWDDTLLALFEIPRSLLPEVVNSSAQIAHTAEPIFGGSIAIGSCIGDQQSALFGQCCFDAGMAKNTYGTGCFMLMNTAKTAQFSHHQLLTTIAWRQPQQPAATYYALEGSVFMGGAIVQWLRDNLGIIQQSQDVEHSAKQVTSSEGVVLIPAFTGLGAPHWNTEAKAMLCGMTRDTNRHHIARAALEAIALQSADVLRAMQQDAETHLIELRVDGGACINDTLMQFQADILNVPVLRPKIRETTAWGAALLAGLSCGIYQNLDELSALWQEERRFEPQMSHDQRQAHLNKWHNALERVLMH